MPGGQTAGPRLRENLSCQQEGDQLGLSHGPSREGSRPHVRVLEGQLGPSSDAGSTASLADDPESCRVK